VGAKVRRSNEGRSASFKFSSSFLCRSAVFQKLAVAQRAGARLSLMEGRVWLRRRIGGGGGGGWTDYVTIVVQSSRSRLKAFVADLGVAALTTMSHENSSIMTSRTGQGGPPVGGVPAISDDRLVIVVVVPKQKKDQKRSDGCVS
jgi:hypothetical protein